jgi:nicotinate-nucleotide--dimethylbenzimidazole phosphoribosyltransferase
MQIIKNTINMIKPVDNLSREKARERLNNLTMPHWALGRIMDLAVDLAGMTRSVNPPLKRKVFVVMAGDHGVTQAGVSKYPAEVTVQMVHNIAAGGAGINALSGGARILLVDMGVNGEFDSLVKQGKVISHKIAPGTANMTEGPAMTREQAEQSLEAGIQIANALAKTTDVFATGDMGIGNTTPSSAILAVLSGCPVADAVGPGTGLNPEQVAAKAAVIEKAIAVNQPDKSDPLDVLAKVGGFEIGGLAGVILRAAALGKPVVIDGFISGAACLIAAGLNSKIKDYAIPSHQSAEPGHQAMMRHLGMRPFLNLGFRLGEGTGAAMMMPLLDAAKNVLTDVATFQEASVSTANK